MNDTISTLLTLIPLALFIGIRMLAERKKKADAEEKKELAATLARLSETPFKPTGGPAGEFSAHALKPDEEAPKPRPAKARPRSLLAPLEPKAADAPAAAPTPFVEPVPAAKAVPPAAPAQAAESGPFARLEKLPPLKRAVAFSELLGAPKGL